MYSKSSQNQNGIHEINIIPFVDIALVLLIIFMISTPALVYKGMQVSLPKVVNAQDISHVTLSIGMSEAGELSLDGKPITLAQLQEIYLDLDANKSATDVVLSADVRTPHGLVMKTVDSLRTLGIEQIGFAVLPKSHTPTLVE